MSGSGGTAGRAVDTSDPTDMRTLLASEHGCGVSAACGLAITGQPVGTGMAHLRICPGVPTISGLSDPRFPRHLESRNVWRSVTAVRCAIGATRLTRRGVDHGSL